MKKLILIPSLAIAATLPALCAVSCGAATSKWNLKDGEFKWKHGLAEGSVNSEEEATNRYFNEIDNKLLADDMIKWGADSTLITQDLYTKFECESEVTKINKKEHRVSFMFYVMFEQKEENLGVFLRDLTITCTNFPVKLFSVNPNNDVVLDNYWVLGQVELKSTNKRAVIPESYRKDTKWSFSIKGVLNSEYVNDTINYNSPDEGHADAIQWCFAKSLTEYSWYFQNVSLSE